jgi:hypothetical protein
MTFLTLALVLGLQPDVCQDVCAQQSVEKESQSTLLWSGLGIAGAGAGTFLVSHGGAVLVTALAGAPPQIVGRVALPIVGPALVISETGVPNEFVPVAIGLFGAQALGLGAMLVGGGMAGSAVVMELDE